jgi:hypothetical protein
MKTPFEDAERFIQLRKICSPKAWGETMIRINEMIIAPLIGIFMFFIRKSDLITLLPTLFTTYRVWMEWIEYQGLRFRMQEMLLITMKTGGPFIVTNDSTYMPYVYADAVVRHDMLHQGSE